VSSLVIEFLFLRLGNKMIKATKKNITLLSTMLMGPISLSLLIISVYLIQPKVEAKLTSNVKSVLEENNISANISFSGRDGILKGDVASQEIADQAEKLSLGVFGTRVIRNQLTVQEQGETQAKVDMPNPKATIKENTPLIKPSQEINKDIRMTMLPIKKEDGISDIDKIMANMQQAALSKPKYKPAILIETKNVVKNAALAVTKSIVIADESSEPSDSSEPIKKQNKPEVVIAISTDNGMPVLVSEKSQTIKNSPNTVLGIIDDFNSFLSPQNEKRIVAKKSTQESTNRNGSPTVLENIDLSLIKFSKDSAVLLRESHVTLGQLSESIKTYYRAPIDIASYADNSDIAYARGAAIRDYLVKQGINRSKIGVAGHTIAKGMENVEYIKINVRP